MTIKDVTTDTTLSHKASSFGADVDPFSGVSMGSSDFDPTSVVSTDIIDQWQKDPNDPVSSSEAVGQYGTAFTTTGGTVSTTPIVASGYPPVANGYHLLEGVSIDRLPPQFRRMLLSPSASQDNQGATVEVGFDYYPSSIPTNPLYIFLYYLIGGVVLISFCVFGDAMIVPQIIIACVSIIVIARGVLVAIYSKRRRESLYISGSDGKRKFCKEHWKGGVYLVGNEALIHYDGFRAWCFPVDTFLRVEVSEDAEVDWGSGTTNTFLILESRTKCLKQNKRHILDVKSEMGRQIHIWHARVRSIE